MGNQSIIGVVYNNLEIITDPISVFKSGKKRKQVTCKCKCGKIVENITLNSVVSGHTLSCGCIKLKYNERRKAQLMRAVHGSMIQRCNNKKHRAYRFYGAKGISVCDEWLDFRNFYNDMQESWELGLELDREDFRGNYCKENCRWVTKIVQQRNKSSVVFNETEVIKIRESNISQYSLAKFYNVNQSTISRIKNNKRWKTN